MFAIPRKFPQAWALRSQDITIHISGVINGVESLQLILDVHAEEVSDTRIDVGQLCGDVLICEPNLIRADLLPIGGMCWPALSKFGFFVANRFTRGAKAHPIGQLN